MSSKTPVVDGDMRRALCSQPLAQEHHGGSRKAQGAGEGGGWIWAVWCSPWCFWEQQHVWILLLFSIYSCRHSEQEQKLRRALAPSLPLAEPPAQPDSSLGSLQHCAAEGLSLPDRAPHGCSIGASPEPEHWAKAAGLECDCPALSEGVCRLDQRPQEGDLTRGLAKHCLKVLMVTSSGCQTQAALSRCFPEWPAAPWLGAGMGSAVPTVLLATTRPPWETAGKGRS